MMIWSCELYNFTLTHAGTMNPLPWTYGSRPTDFSFQEKSAWHWRRRWRTIFRLSMCEIIHYQVTLVVEPPGGSVDPLGY